MNSYISYTTLSDYNFVCLKFDFSRVEIFNNELLKDNVFCDSLIDVINNASECSLFHTEPLVWWDNLKFKMKKCAVNYAIKKT